MNRMPIWMDCDTGTDDAVAIMLAHALPELEIKGISAVCGNAEQEKTYWNTQRVIGLVGARYPVYRGAERPLMKPLTTAAHAHGQNGLGGVELPVPEDAAVPELPAWDALYECARQYPGELRLIATAPLTNIAIAFTKHPDLPGLLRDMLVMGGSAGRGNITPAAEFNFFVDPHAASVVFRSGVKLTMCGLDVTLQAYLTRAQLDGFAASGTRVGRFVSECTRPGRKLAEKFGLPGFSMHDCCPVMFAAHPELFGGEMAGVVIETRGDITSGKSVTDLYSDKQFPFKNAFVVLKLDRERFISILTERLLSLG